MIKDFRDACFQELIERHFADIIVVDFELSENQKLRAKQLIKNTQENIDRIKNSINTYSDNWSYDRIGKVERRRWPMP